MNPLSEARPDSPFAQRYQMLIRVAQAIKSHRGSNDLFDALAPELRKVVEFDVIYCIRYDQAANQVAWIGSRSSSGVERPEFPPQDMLVAWVYQHQLPLVIPDLQREIRFPRVAEFLRQQGLRSVCALPLTTVRRRIGSFGFGSQQPNAYSAEEVQFLTLVVDQIALAIDDALHAEELERQNQRLTLLLDLNNAVVSNLELRDLLQAMSASVRRVMQCDGVGVALPDLETQELRLYAFDFPGRDGIVQQETAVALDGALAPARVFRSGHPEVVNGIDPRQGNADLPAPAIALGVRCVCYLPLASRGRTLGVLILGRLEEKAFTEDEVDFLTRLANQLALAVENALAYREIGNLKDKLTQEKVYFEDEIRSEMNFEEIVGRSAELRTLLQQVEVVAPTGSTVLIYGETGTGKELIARAIHDLSPRRESAFVKLNCAAIPAGLLESELFGHEKGAFTGAVAQRIGRFEVGSRGTVFLDEVGEIPLELQPKLLRVLQEREFERLGSSRTLRTDARLIAATNQDLAAMVEAQKFRSDLYYRLNVFPLRVPPLRERRGDIPLLVRHFVQQYARRMNRTIDTIPSETMQVLIDYDWPGNIRELQNLMERAVILSPGPVLKVPLAGLQNRPARAEPPNRASFSNGSSIRIDTLPAGIGTLEDAERRHITDALNATDWVVGGPHGAAALLGMKRTTLQFRINKLGIAKS
jgi:formate hydrogenlyase transcriptional activator